MALPIISEIEKLINEHGSASILRERISLLLDQFKLMEQKVSDLEQEKAAMKEKFKEQEAELVSYRALEQFVEHRGAFFQRKPEGGYRLQVFCPSCRGIASAMNHRLPYRCHKCHWTASFTPGLFDKVMSELPD